MIYKTVKVIYVEMSMQMSSDKSFNEVDMLSVVYAETQITLISKPAPS
jgi:hypothetical protein